MKIDKNLKLTRLSNKILLKKDKERGSITAENLGRLLYFFCFITENTS